MAKLIINNDDVVSEFFENTRILGIMTSLKDYQFCWKINTSLGMSFKVNNDLEVMLKRKGRTYHFGIYEYKEPATFLCHYLYTNYNDGEYLLPELKNFDFIWLMKEDIVPDTLLHDIRAWIKDINEVQLVAAIGLDKIKNKSSLIF